MWLFNRTNSWEHVGRTGIWRGQIESATFASYLVRLNPHPAKLLPEMLNFWPELGTDADRHAPTSHTRCPASEHQSDESSLNSRRVPENLDEQTAITVRISAAREAFNAYREHVYKLKSVKPVLCRTSWREIVA